MTTDKTEARRTPAYAPYESFNRLLGRMKDALPLPRPLDSSFWARMRFSGSMTSALKNTLIYLGLLTEENIPTEDLEELVQANPEERKVILRQIFDRAYEPILIRLDLERAQRPQLKAEFKALGADGEVGEKAISFFLAVAKEVGKKLHKYLTVRQPRALGSKKPGPKPKGEQVATKGRKPPGIADEHREQVSQVQLVSGGIVTLAVDVDLFQLSKEDRDFVLGLIDMMKGYKNKKQ